MDANLPKPRAWHYLCHELWGQALACGGLQPAEPAALRVFFLDSSKARSNWVLEYVIFEALKLLFSANEGIIALSRQNSFPLMPAPQLITQ
jgi:hypothetical protein